jgi:hypothetical protein
VSRKCLRELSNYLDGIDGDVRVGHSADWPRK